MKNLRQIAMDFSRLPLSQRNDIAQRLNLVSDDDWNESDRTRWFNVIRRARETGMVEALGRETDKVLAGQS
jgi:hypothetical protein